MPGCGVIVDPMYGVGQLTLGTVLTEARCRVTFIHERHNPLFGGRSPAPNEDALRVLSSEMQERQYDLGLAMDGDADRVAILDERGRYISINDILVLLYWYLHEVRGQRGGVVRNLSTTHMLDRLARKLGEQCYEKPVGFKHIAAGMVEQNALLGGESSGGLTIRGHILGKDGIFACALIVEMLARTGRKVSALMDDLYTDDRKTVLHGREPARDAGDESRGSAADEERGAGCESGRTRCCEPRSWTASSCCSRTTTGPCCASPEPSQCCGSRWKPIARTRRASLLTVAAPICDRGERATLVAAATHDVAAICRTIAQP